MQGPQISLRPHFPSVVLPYGPAEPLSAHLPFRGITPSSFPSQRRETQPGQQLHSPVHLTRGHLSIA